MSLADTGASTSVDTGATLALFPPDIPIEVAAPSFDPSINYVQAPVSAPYDPTGYPVTLQAVDATQATIVNANSMPISTEDAVAYSATLGPASGTTTYFGANGQIVTTDAATGSTQYFDPAGSYVKNASGLTGAQATTPTAVGAGDINAGLHGVADALTSLVKVGVAVDTLSNIKQVTTGQSTAQPGVGLLSPLTARIQAPPGYPAATVGGQPMLGGSILPLALIAVAIYFATRGG